MSVSPRGQASSHVVVATTQLANAYPTTETRVASRNNTSHATVLGMGYVMRRLALLNADDGDASSSSSAGRHNSRSRTQSAINSIAGDRIRSSVGSRQQILAASISSLPLASQKDFRRKMLTIFALQLLFVWCLVSLMCFITSLHDKLGRNFSQHNSYALISAGITVVCLVLLYAVRELFPWNWLAVAVFSVALSVFYVGVGSLFGTYIPWYTCAFNLFEVLLMIFFSTREQKPKQDAGSQRPTTHTLQNKGKLMSSMRAGLLSYAIVGTGAVVLYLVLHQKDTSSDSIMSMGHGAWRISARGFTYLMLLELFLIIWFSYDASCMYCVLTPDEYMRSIIYFYTDLVILSVFVILLVAFSMGCTIFSCSSSAGDFFDCLFCNCCHSGSCGLGVVGSCNCCMFGGRAIQPEENPA